MPNSPGAELTIYAGAEFTRWRADLLPNFNIGFLRFSVENIFTHAFGASGVVPKENKYKEKLP